MKHLFVLLLVPLGGCASLGRNPVAENVVLSRQLSHRGIDAMQRGQWDEAEMMFAEAIDLCEADERAHRRYAETLWRRGAWQEAIRHMHSAVSLSGGDVKLRVQLGEMHLSRGNVDLASEQAEAAIRGPRPSADAWRLRGDVLRRRGQSEEAMSSYHRALSIEAHQPAAQLALSEMYLQRQRPRRALSTLESLARSYPPDELPRDVMLLQGYALKQLNRHDDAVVVLSEAAKQVPVTGEVLFQLAETQFLAGDLASAQVAALNALARTPEDGRAQALLATIRNSVPDAHRQLR
jgi:tetratricopeptide (TPR) repeat protein